MPLPEVRQLSSVCYGWLTIVAAGVTNNCGRFIHYLDDSYGPGYHEAYFHDELDRIEQAA